MSTSAQFPSGAVVRRGDPILVANGGLIMTAYVDTLGESDGYPFVRVLIINGSRNALDAGQTNDAVLYDGAGYRHISVPPTVHGNRFCLVDDREEEALRAYAADAVDGVIGGDYVPPVEVAVPDTAPLAEQPTPAPTGTDDPRDTNKDGHVDKAEKKAWKREHPDG